MAGSKYTPPLKLTREQLAEFLPDHQMIRTFENLFAVVEPLAPDTLNDILIMAGQADNKAIQALQSLAEIAQTAAINSGAAEDRATQALQAIAQLAQDAALCCAVAEAKGTQAIGSIAALEQDTAVTASVLEARVTQALDAISALTQSVELLALAPPPREFKRARYGAFYSTATQTATVVNTAKLITYNTTQLSQGVYVDSVVTSRVYVDTDGIYNFQTSIQLDSTVSTAEEFYLWFRQNGVDITDSASQVRVQGNNAEVFVALNFFFDLVAGDYVELVFSVSSLGVILLAAPAAAPHPGIPSIILTVANNIEGIQ
jgi:L-fucose mutarotase/ribose pyranase (RbsD/FucU family)